MLKNKVTAAALACMLFACCISALAPCYQADPPFHTPYVVKGTVFQVGHALPAGNASVSGRNLRTSELVEAEADLDGLYQLTFSQGVEDGDVLNLTATWDDWQGWGDMTVNNAGSWGIVMNLTVEHACTQENGDEDDGFQLQPLHIVALAFILVLTVLALILLSRKRSRGRDGK